MPMILTVPKQPCECGSPRFIFVSETDKAWTLKCEKCDAEYELQKPPYTKETSA